MNALIALRHLTLVIAIALMGLFTACSNNKSSGDLSLNPLGCVEDEDEPGDIDANDAEEDGGADDEAGECDDD